MGEMFDKWHPVFRWFAFIPVFFLTYLIMWFLQAYSLGFVLGGYDESSFFNFIIYRAYLDIALIGMSIFVSSRCAPKGRIVIALAYGALFFGLQGFALAVAILQGSDLPMWKNIYSAITLSIGVICGIGATFIDVADKKNDSHNDDYLSGINTDNMD